MDWNLKAPSWDFTEFAQQTLPNIHGAGVANRCNNPSAEGEFSVDLKLGQVSNMAREPVDKWKETGVLKTMSPPSASSKRPRSANSCNQVVHCLVDGCNADLSNCREYHRRHKVCEVHSKTPEVSINGQRQRFCQQCSRFHSLEEFDEGKRSCRKRLDGHNRRRRKPQPDSMTRPGDILSHFQGTHLLTFSNSHVYPSTAVGNPTWAGMINTEAEATYYNHHQQLHLSEKQNLLLGPSSSMYGGGKQIKLPLGNNLVPSNQMSSEAFVREPIARTIGSSESCGPGRNGLYDRLVGESDCALSLLSSPQMQTSGITFSDTVHPNSFRDDRSVEPLDSIRDASSSGTNTDSLGMFHIHIGSDERPRNEVSQVIPFRWD